MEEKKQASNTQKASFNWFPGHMQKAKRQMQEALPLVDIVIELRDARIPWGSENPLIRDIIGQKPRMIILTKKDMADPKRTAEWIEKYENMGIHTIAVNSNKDDLKKIIPTEVKIQLKDKLERAKARGIRKKMLRAMVVGIPNVGKSTLINGVVKKKVAKVENRAGVTRNLQWVKLNEDVELLDTPGVLWPRFDNEVVAFHLALVGSLNDKVVVDKVKLIYRALTHLHTDYREVLNERYDINVEECDPQKILEAIATSKKIVSLGGELDIDKTVDFILADIRNDRLKNVSWEYAYFGE